MPKGFGCKIRPDENLARIIGSEELTIGQMQKKLWNYIKTKNLMVK